MTSGFFQSLPPGSHLGQPHVLLATWFGSGLVRSAPGTIGSLAALPFAWAIVSFGGAWALTVATFLVLIIGTKVANIYNAASDQHDSSAIVIDEVAGMWLALIPAALVPSLWGMAFFLFRLFDILKPWPCSHYDKKSSGGWPVMMDDICAGLYAFIGVAACAFFLRMS